MTDDEHEMLARLHQELMGVEALDHLEAFSNIPLSLTSKVLSRVLFLDHIYKKIVGLHGAVMDFGTRHGSNAVVFSNLRSIYEPFNRHRKIIAFDTFEGFPCVTVEDGNSSLMQKGNLALPKGYEENLDRLLNLHEAMNPAPHIVKHEVVKGDVCETLPAYFERNPETVVALAYFDMDIYEPTKKALRELYNGRLMRGAILAFDELCDHDSPGETRALREIFSEFPKLHRLPFCSRTSYYVVGE